MGTKKLDYESKKTFIVNTFFIALVGLLIFLTFKFLLGFLLPFIIAAALSFILEKPARYLKKKTFLNEDIMRCVFLVVVYLLIAVTLTIAVLSVISNSDKILGGIKDYFERQDNIFSKISEIFANLISSLPKSLRSSAEDIFSAMSKRIITFITGLISDFFGGLTRFLPSFLISSLVTVVASFYIAKDYKKLIKFLKGILGEKKYAVLTEIKDIFTSSVSRVMSGYLIMASITFVELLIGFKVLGFENAVILSILTAFLDLLPVIGVGSVLIPLSIFEFIKNDIFKGVGLLVLYLFITLLRNFIEPKLIGKRVDINPLFMLAAIFIGLKIGGVYGMFLLPVSLIVTVNYYKRQLEKEKGIIS